MRLANTSQAMARKEPVYPLTARLRNADRKSNTANDGLVRGDDSAAAAIASAPAEPTPTTANANRASRRPHVSRLSSHFMLPRNSAPKSRMCYS